MSYKYKSGAQKRREHDAKVASASEGVRKLSAFGFSATPADDAITSTSVPVEETNASEACISGINQHDINDVQCDDVAKPLQPQMESSSDIFESPMSCDVGEIDNVPTPYQIGRASCRERV